MQATGGGWGTKASCFFFRNSVVRKHKSYIKNNVVKRNYFYEYRASGHSSMLSKKHKEGRGKQMKFLENKNWQLRIYYVAK